MARASIAVPGLAVGRQAGRRPCPSPCHLRCPASCPTIKQAVNRILHLLCAQAGGCLGGGAGAGPATAAGAAAAAAAAAAAGLCRVVQHLAGCPQPRHHPLPVLRLRKAPELHRHLERASGAPARRGPTPRDVMTSNLGSLQANRREPRRAATHGTIPSRTSKPWSMSGDSCKAEMGSPGGTDAGR